MRFYQQIKWKLTLVIMITSIVVLMLGAVAVVGHDRLNSRRNLMSQLETMAKITAANAAASLAFHDRSDAQETLNALGSQPEIDYACLCLLDRRPFVQLVRDDIRPAFNSVDVLMEGHHIKNNKLIFQRHILFDRDLVGWIVLEANLDYEAARAGAFLRIAGLTVVGLILVALWLGVRLQRLISDPIAELVASAGHITRYKDYSVRVAPDSTDEIGTLVRAFNQMLAEIEIQNRNLVSSQRQLKLALAAAQMGTWEWDVPANRVTWSVEASPWLGEGTAPVTIEAFARRLHEEDADRTLAVFEEAFATAAGFAIEYRVRQPDGDVLWVAHHGQVRLADGAQPGGVTGIMQNITRRKRTEADRQHLAAKLLHAEESERRRIARELHDTTAQQLAAIKIGLMQARETDATSRAAQIIPDSCAQLEQAIQDLRTLTYVLHPPLLEELGLAGALRELAAGLARRSSVRVKVSADGYAGRLAGNLELTLFRVVQEAIANAVRHSGTREILISLAHDGQEVRVEVQDFGCGLPAGKADSQAVRVTGVGIAAMEERMALIGGRLMVESDPEGVTVLASAPVGEEVAAPALFIPDES